MTIHDFQFQSNGAEFWPRRTIRSGSVKTLTIRMYPNPDSNSILCQCYFGIFGNLLREKSWRHYNWDQADDEVSWLWIFGHDPQYSNNIDTVTVTTYSNNYQQILKSKSAFESFAPSLLVCRSHPLLYLKFNQSDVPATDAIEFEERGT